MSNIYYIDPEKSRIENNDTTDPNYQIPSVSYVNSLIKKIEDIIITHENSSDAHKFNNNNIKLIDFKDGITSIELAMQNKYDKVPASEIDVDSTHQFITQAQLNIFKDKPSTLQIQNLIMDLRNEIKTSLNDYFNKLINKNNVINKLHDMAYFLEENDNFNNIIEALSDKVSLDDMDDHINSDLHLNNNDRKALNLLLSFIKIGCADWNADESAPNYIRNKPISLPANGGDADSVNGIPGDKLINRQPYTKIYGQIGFGYNKNQVDLIIDKSTEYDIITSLSDNMGGSYFFRRGIYTINSKVNIVSNKVYICGESNNLTTLTIDAITISGNTIIKDICLKDCIIYVNNECTFNNVIFDNCEFRLASSDINITNCKFINKSIRFTGASTNCIIKDNRFVNCDLPVYYGGNNIIKDNLKY